MFFWFVGRSHKRYQQMLSEHLDGRLDPKAQARLQAHLATCVQCRRAEAELRKVVAALRTLPLAPFPRSFALQRAPLPSPPARSKRVLSPLGAMQAATAVSALALVALVLADLAGYPADGLPMPAQPAALYQAAAVTAEGSTAQPAEQVSLAAAAPAEPPVEPAAGAGAVVAGQEAPAEGEPVTLTSSLPEASPSVDERAQADEKVATPAAPLVLPDAERTPREWLLLATALATAILALSAIAWTWWLRGRAPR